jgi:hypothetical protein
MTLINVFMPVYIAATGINPMPAGVAAPDRSQDPEIVEKRAAPGSVM